jgi:peptide/nickel transport system substrate-binding protein
MEGHGQLPGRPRRRRAALHLRRGNPRGHRRTAALIAAAAAVMLVAAACGGGSGGSGSSVKDGGVFRLGSNSSIDSLNPFVAFQGDAYVTFEYIYPMLVQYNPQLKFAADFARSWTESPDGKVWTFHTQPGAKWSDGKPLTAADAAWTYQTILKYQDGATANSAGYVAHLKSATAPNATTLVLTYKRPVANVLSQVQQVPILPEHVWAKYATGNGKALTRFSNNAPIVSGGPFILTKYTPKQIALFKRNPTFYGPKPHVDGFGLQFFQTTDAMITALKSHQLDGVEVVPPTSVATLKSSGFVVRSSPGVVFDDFIVNANPQQEASHKELVNPLVRQAFDDAIDRQAIVSTSLLGHGQPGSSIIPPATGHWYDPAVKPNPFNLAKANQLLDQAGYKMGPGGVRMANGHPMSYQVIMPTDIQNSYGQRSFQIIQPDFKKIGVQLNLKVLDDSAAYNAITANGYKDFEISMWDWYPLTDPDFMLSVLTCGSWNVWNDTGYCSKAYDSLYQAQSAAASPAKRQQIVYQMQQMIASQRVYLVLDFPDAIEAHSTAWADLPLVAGISWNSMSKIPFESVHQAG